MSDTKDVRKDWFMNQHFDEGQLQQIFDWEQKSGKVAKVVPTQDGFILVHIEDTGHKIDLCFQKEEYELRRWAERLGYKTSDGKTAKQFEEENGIKDEPIEYGKEVYREGNTSLTFYAGKKEYSLVSGGFGLAAKRTASNAFTIRLLNSAEYADYLNSDDSKIFTANELRKIVQAIYSEFAELDRSRYSPHELRRIIELEVEQSHKPVKIFKE